MKIEQVEVYHIQPRWMLVKVSTDEGISGWGEPTLEGKARVVEEAVKVFAEALIGEDPMKIEYLYNKMYRGGFYRGGAVLCSAISGIEQALWDIKGKKLGVPVWQLLGGKCRDKIRMYAHAVPFNDNPNEEEIKYWIEKRVGDGFTALKTSMVAPPIRHIDTFGKVKEIVRKIACMRETAGEETDIAIDFHGRISEKSAIPIAAGERLFTTYGFREIIEKQAVQIVQPDICHCGGILQGLKIAAMAQNYYMSVALHNPLGPVALSACLQLDTCIMNFTAQEHPTHEEKWDLGAGLFKRPFEIKEGYIDVPTLPGLGFEMDEDMVRERKYDGKWTNPVLYFKDDNSMGEW